MRVKIHLETDEHMIIPINYQHAMQGLLYKALGAGDSEFTDKLHKLGYRQSGASTQKAFKFFCFSGLGFGQRYMLDANKENFIFSRNRYHKSKIHFMVSSPLEELTHHLINGLFRIGNEISLANNRLTVSRVSVQEAYQLNDEMFFKPVFSPIVMRSQQTGSFLTYTDPMIESLLVNNLLSKYQILHPDATDIPKEQIQIKFLPELLSDKSPKTKLITFHTGQEGKHLEIKTKGNLVPVKIQAPASLIQTALDCGLGEKNSSGFGFVDILKIS